MGGIHPYSTSVGRILRTPTCVNTDENARCREQTPGLCKGVLIFPNKPLVNVVGLRGPFLGDVLASLVYP